MKPLTLIFVGLLFGSQCAAGEQLTSKPLSMFRDGELSVVGYALFAVLLSIGTLMMHRLHRLGRLGDAVVFAFAVALLMLVTATPSLNAWHEAGATLLLLTLFGYYALVLLLARSGWLYLHLAAPLVLTPLLGDGYGPWQKGVILYLVVAVNVHWHLLADHATQSRRSSSSLLGKRRVIYRVEEGKAWQRRRLAAGASYV